MNIDDKNISLNHFASSVLGNNQLSTLAVASTALLGGALYYYMNKSPSVVKATEHQIDFKDQTRELEVLRRCFLNSRFFK